MKDPRDLSLDTMFPRKPISQGLHSFDDLALTEPLSAKEQFAKYKTEPYKEEHVVELTPKSAWWSTPMCEFGFLRIDDIRFENADDVYIRIDNGVENITRPSFVNHVNPKKDKALREISNRQMSLGFTVQEVKELFAKGPIYSTPGSTLRVMLQWEPSVSPADAKTVSFAIVGQAPVEDSDA